MVVQLLLIPILAIAIDQITDMTTSLDLLEGIRAKFRLTFPRLAKLSWCSFCQSFWLSGIAAWFMPMDIAYLVFNCFFFKWGLAWLAIFAVRNYINRHFALVSTTEDMIRSQISDQHLES
jgi:hypothetical protein